MLTRRRNPCCAQEAIPVPPSGMAAACSSLGVLCGPDMSPTSHGVSNFLSASAGLESGFCF